MAPLPTGEYLFLIEAFPDELLVCWLVTLIAFEMSGPL
jgi:hypothetical protein